MKTALGESGGARANKDSSCGMVRESMCRARDGEMHAAREAGSGARGRTEDRRQDDLLPIGPTRTL